VEVMLTCNNGHSKNYSFIQEGMKCPVCLLKLKIVVRRKVPSANRRHLRKRELKQINFKRKSWL